MPRETPIPRHDGVGVGDGIEVVGPIQGLQCNARSAQQESAPPPPVAEPKVSQPPELVIVVPKKDTMRVINNQENIPFANKPQTGMFISLPDIAVNDSAACRTVLVYYGRKNSFSQTKNGVFV
jgi:hypothetical protein